MDVLDTILGRRDPLIPPRGYWFIGGGKRFREIDEETFGYLRTAGLAPQHHVLDMGCGVGFMGIRLTRFLTSGSYDGFDVVRPLVEWASAHITKLHPNFRFQHADVYSRHYNPHGRFKPEEFPFPYESGSLDFAFGLSLLTHLVPRSAEHYLQETARVLKSRGTAWVSAFLINEESAALVKAGKSVYALSPSGNCWVLDPAFPETAVGLPETDFRKWCEAAGFEIRRIDRGSWCGRSQYVGGHDHAILEKK